jgi:hypothetical protein
MCYSCNKCNACGKFDNEEFVISKKPGLKCSVCGGLISLSSGMCEVCGHEEFAQPGCRPGSAESGGRGNDASRSE